MKMISLETSLVMMRSSMATVREMILRMVMVVRFVWLLMIMVASLSELHNFK